MLVITRGYPLNKVRSATRSSCGSGSQEPEIIEDKSAALTQLRLETARHAAPRPLWFWKPQKKAERRGAQPGWWLKNMMCPAIFQVSVECISLRAFVIYGKFIQTWKMMTLEMVEISPQIRTTC